MKLATVTLLIGSAYGWANYAELTACAAQGDDATKEANEAPAGPICPNDGELCLTRTIDKVKKTSDSKYKKAKKADPGLVAGETATACVPDGATELGTSGTTDGAGVTVSYVENKYTPPPEEEAPAEGDGGEEEEKKDSAIKLAGTFAALTVMATMY